MLTKLQSIFPNALFFPSPPKEHLDGYDLFFDRSHNEWIGIPKSDLSEKEKEILKTLFEYSEPATSSVSPLTKSWYEFLYFNGPLPAGIAPTVRFIQFHISGSEVEQEEIESALKGFFSKEILIIWENKQSGVVIENQKLLTLSENELSSIRDTFESDFYLSISLYVGKKHTHSPQLSTYFKEEREYFTFAQIHLNQINILTFEKVFPYYLAFYLPENLKTIVNQTLSEVFEEEPELFSTLKVFLENNLNASVTAKKLYIHRNTLQYRIDKFTEKTGIQLKDFYGAFTVFLSCLIHELKK